MPPADDSRIPIREGYYLLIIVQGDEVTHYTPDFGLFHVDFVKR